MLPTAAPQSTPHACGGTTSSPSRSGLLLGEGATLTCLSIRLHLLGGGGCFPPFLISPLGYKKQASGIAGRLLIHVDAANAGSLQSMLLLVLHGCMGYKYLHHTHSSNQQEGQCSDLGRDLLQLLPLDPGKLSPFVLNYCEGAL